MNQKSLHDYFSTGTSLSSKSASGHDTGSSDSSCDEAEEITTPSPPKKLCTSCTLYGSQMKPVSSKRQYNKKWEEQFSWLEYDEDTHGAFCKECRKSGRHMQRTGGTWVIKPFKNWRKALEKMRAHSESDTHIQACQASMLAKQALQNGTIAQQLQQISNEEKKKNRTAIKALIRCTHFLAHQHIAHTTTFDKLVNLVVSCGGQDLKTFLETTGKKAQYTSRIAVIEFLEALGTWIEESILKRIRQAPFYSIMADECVDVTTIEELSIFCRWVENGEAVEHFVEIIPMKITDADNIHSALVDCLKSKKISLSKLIGMGFDGAATFSGKRTGVQARLKAHAPHAIFVHCHCHKLQLACVQAANATAGINHVYVTLTSLWKFFHFSPKRAQSLKEVQKVLNLPELTVIKPSDTRWLAHERCVQTVKASYSAIVTTLGHIYTQSHEPEALGLKKVLCRKSTVAAIYMLDYVLSQVAKLSKALQTRRLDLSMISCLMEVTISSLDDAVIPAANWVLELKDATQELETAIESQITALDVSSFQDKVGKPFLDLLKYNITSRFSSSDIVESFSIFDPKKVPASDSPSYGDDSVSLLADHYGKDLPAKSVVGIESTKDAVISKEVKTEWKTYRTMLTKYPKEDLRSQLKELASDETLIALLPNLHKLAMICLTLPVSTASVERSFSHMKLIKTRLRSRLTESSLSNLMKIAIESPDFLSDTDVEEVISVWSRKRRRIAV